MFSYPGYPVSLGAGSSVVHLEMVKLKSVTPLPCFSLTILMWVILFNP